MGASGQTTVDFGAFPGSSHASVAVAEAGVGAASEVEAWVMPAATADHTADEHLVETLRVVAGDVQAGVGFTIHAVNTSQLNEPVSDPVHATSVFTSSATAIGVKSAQPGAVAYGGGRGTRLYGAWNVAWAWN